MSFLFRPVDIASLCFFRVVFGLLGFIDVIGIYIHQHWQIEALQPDGFRFKYLGFEWVEPLPEPFLSLAFLVIALAAVGVLLGWRYRLCATVFAIGFTWTFLMTKSFYLNHGYLFSVLSFVMILLPVHRNYSLDVWQGRVKRVGEIPRWPVLLMCFLMGVVYFYGGIAKVNPDWLQAMPLKMWLGYKKDYFLIGPVLEKELAAYLMSYGGLLLDLTVVFFLLFRRTRIWAFLFVLFFHFINLLVFQIGIFPWLSTALTAMYFPADFPRKVFRWLGRKMGGSSERVAGPHPDGTLPTGWQEGKLAHNVRGADSEEVADLAKSTKMAWLARLFERWNVGWSRIPEVPYPGAVFGRKAITGCLFVFCLLQLLIPLRHHLYPGDVAWTEEGHRFSWRMMLRSKTGFGSFEVVEPHTGRKEKVRPKEYLHKRQSRKLYGQPDMIVEFAHFIRDEYVAKGWKDPQVYSHIKTKLNGRKYHYIIDPKYDLAKARLSWWRSGEWIEWDAELGPLPE